MEQIVYRLATSWSADRVNGDRTRSQPNTSGRITSVFTYKTHGRRVRSLPSTEVYGGNRTSGRTIIVPRLPNTIKRGSIKVFEAPCIRMPPQEYSFRAIPEPQTSAHPNTNQPGCISRRERAWRGIRRATE